MGRPDLISIVLVLHVGEQRWGAVKVVEVVLVVRAVVAGVPSRSQVRPFRLA